MGNGVKALLVALLILSVVIIAKVVQDDSDPANAEPNKTLANEGNDPSNKNITTTPKRTHTNASPNKSSINKNQVVGQKKTTAQLNREAYQRRQEELRKQNEQRLAAQNRANQNRANQNRANQNNGQNNGFNLRNNRQNQGTSPQGNNPQGQNSIDKSNDEDRVIAQAKPKGNVITMAKGNEIKKGNQNVYEDPLEGTQLSGPNKSGKGKINNHSNINTNQNPRQGYKPSHSNLDNLAQQAGNKNNQGTIPKLTNNGSTPGFNKPIGNTPNKQKIAGQNQGTRNQGAKANNSSTLPFPRVHVVQSGDSFWRIAEKYYGEVGAKYYKNIQRANPGKKMIPGVKVTVPAPPVKLTATKKIVKDPKKTVSKKTNNKTVINAKLSKDGRHYLHKVVKGDTLSGLSLKYYKNPRNYGPIVDANPELRVFNLQIGQTVKIPRK